MATVLVTGANRGIGLEFVKQYAADGYDVIACCRQPSKAESLQQLVGENNRITVESLDVAKQEQIQALATALAGISIDILINNAGVYGSAAKRLGSLDADEMIELFRINALGPLKMADVLLDNILASHMKTIVTISSGMGSIASNTRGDAYSYRASKAAVNAMMQSMAIDLAEHGVKVLALCPGWVRTDLGGENASLAPSESVAGMRNVIADELRLPAPGFYRHDGQMIPW